MYGLAKIPMQYGAFVAVTSIDEMVDLIKEAEVLTNRPGRWFIFAHDASEKRYRVAIEGGAWFINLNEAITVEQLLSSDIGVALVAGRLYTEAV